MNAMWSYGITVGDLCLLTGKEAISKIEMCDLVLMCSGLYMEFSNATVLWTINFTAFEEFYAKISFHRFLSLCISLWD